MEKRRDPSHRKAVAAFAIGATLSLSLMVDSQAMQPRDAGEQPRAVSAQAKGKAATQSPLAERKPLKRTLTPRQDFRMNQVVGLYNGGRRAEARLAADAILADPAATEFESASAARIAGQAAFEMGDADAAITYYQQVIRFDVLENDAHFGAMRNLAILLQQQKRHAESVAMFERLFAESRTRDPSDLVAQGQSLHLLERHVEAAEVIERAIIASKEPDPRWQALLMHAKMKAGNPADALLLAERVAAESPDDKRAQVNLAVAYQRNDRPTEAAAILERLRAGGRLQGATEYRLLSSLYIDRGGHEEQAAAVIGEGLQAGALPPDFATLETLAKLYYFSDQLAESIDTYKQAAPLDDGAGTYITLASLLWRHKRIAEAQEAARQALDRGVKDPVAAQGARNILRIGVPGIRSPESNGSVMCEACNVVE